MIISKLKKLFSILVLWSKRRFYLFIFSYFMIFICGQLIMQWSQNRVIKNNHIIQNIYINNTEKEIEIHQLMLKILANDTNNQYINPSQVEIIKKCPK